MSKLKRGKHLTIPLEHIKIATKNFKDCIGKGGYGMVYKGELVISGKPTPVAIKRLDEQHGQGLKEFLTAIGLLSGQRHPNLIHLIGYCDEGSEKIIVYEYAEHGSLDKYLRRSNTTQTLTWLVRLKICVGAARGLNFLHNHVGKHQAIIHRDIKSANILIGENWVGKVSDLGLSKLSLAGLNRSDVISNACGTLGYCDPQYLDRGIVTKESDVYSFGMMLFEVFCGRLCTIRDDDGILLSSSWVKDKENKLDEIFDPRLKAEINLKSMNKFASIAYRCLSDDRVQRPPMSLVVKELEESLELQICQSWGLNSYSGRESQGSSSKSYSHMEPRLAKVTKIFELFDVNKDGGLNKEELEALLVATNSELKHCSKEQISSGVDEVFHLYEKFINGEIGLTFDGLLQVYEDGDGDLDMDCEELGIQMKSHNPKEPPFNTWESSNKLFGSLDFIERATSINGAGGFNKEIGWAGQRNGRCRLLL